MKEHMRRILSLTSTQGGAASRGQLRSIGVEGRAIRRLVSAGDLIAKGPEVVIAAGTPPSSELDVIAASLDAAPSAVTHTTAAAWWGVAGFNLRPIQIAREHRGLGRPSLADRIHVVRSLPEAWTTVHRGVRVARPELAVLHLCGTIDLGRAARALDNAWAMRLLSGRSLVALLAEYGEHGRNGTAILRQLVDERGPGYTPPTTNLESRFRDLLAPECLPRMRMQVDSGGERWSGRVDFRAEDLPLVVEVQSERYHSSLSDREADARRTAALEADGFVVLEVTDTAVWQDGRGVADKIRAARRLLLSRR